MRDLKAFAIAGAIGGATLALSTAASASIVCNAEGDCWRTGATYSYPPHASVTIHEDGWKWGDHDRYRWREHEGRGFWKGDRWEEF